MRFLIFSDPHCHTFRPESETLPSGLNSRLQDSLNILEQIYILCRRHEVDCVLCGGDLFHARAVINVSTFNLVYEAIAKIKTTVSNFVLLVGNHDQANKLGTVHATQTFQAIVTVVDSPSWVEIDPETHVFCVPFSESRETIVTSISEGLKNPPSGTKILLGHFGVSGAEPGSNFVMITPDLPNLPDLKYNTFKQVFLGHYHKPQELLPNVRYVGATHQHNWGDIGQKRGAWLWDSNKDVYETPTLQELNAPKYMKIKAYDPIVEKGNFLRVLFDNPIASDKWEALKEQYISEGSRWVEDWYEPKETSVNSSTSVYAPTSDISSMVDQFVDDEKPEGLDPARLKEIGHEFIRSCQ